MLLILIVEISRAIFGAKVIDHFAAVLLVVFDVSTWLDSPDKKVTLDVKMQSLPDGLSYPGAIVLSIPSSNLEVRITKSNYLKLAQ